MKKLCIAAVFLITASQSFAGIVGWLTSHPQDWKFIQSVGGIKIGNVVEMSGKPVLPVTCDVSGFTFVTCRPTAKNSGIVFRKFDVKHTDKDITIRVVTSAPEGNKGSKGEYIDLSGIKPGAYQVYYETAGDPEKRLGAIEIK